MTNIRMCFLSFCHPFFFLSHTRLEREWLTVSPKSLWTDWQRMNFNRAAAVNGREQTCRVHFCRCRLTSLNACARLRGFNRRNCKDSQLKRVHAACSLLCRATVLSLVSVVLSYNRASSLSVALRWCQKRWKSKSKGDKVLKWKPGIEPQTIWWSHGQRGLMQSRSNFLCLLAKKKKVKKAHLHYKQSSRETDELFICLPEMNDINYSFKGATHLHFTETVRGGLCCVNKVKIQHFTLSLIKAKVDP